MAKKKVFSIGNALAEGLEETIAAAHNYSGELRVEVIPLRKIDVDPENPRDLLIDFNDLTTGITAQDPNRHRKLEELASLHSIAHSIKEQGILNPVIVYKYGERYRLIAGERRTLASVVAGKTDIQAKILDSKPTELKISLLQWIENIERSDLSLAERLKNLEKIVAAYAEKNAMQSSAVTVTELSQLIGCTKPHAMNYKAVLNADAQVKHLINENKIRSLEKAAVIADTTAKELQQELITACIAGATLKKLKQLADQRPVRSLSVVTSEKRGRQTTKIDFGFTKNLDVACVILDSVLSNTSIAHITRHFGHVNKQDYRSVSETFKRLLKKLEESHG